MIRIISKKKYTDTFFWTNKNIIDNLDTKFQILNNTEELFKTQKKDFIFHGNGVVIKKDNIFYIVTNFHIVNNSYYVYGFIDILEINPENKDESKNKIINKEIILDKVCDFCEFDLSVYKITETNYKIINFYNYDELETVFPKINNNNNTFIIFKDFNNKLCTQNCEYYGIKTLDIYSCFVKMPIILLNIKLDNKLISSNLSLNSNLAGMSGGSFINNKIFYGLVSFIKHDINKIIIIPNYLIKGVLNNLSEPYNIYCLPNISSSVLLDVTPKTKDSSEVRLLPRNLPAANAEITNTQIQHPNLHNVIACRNCILPIPLSPAAARDNPTVV
jgi:hypothetical protein